MIKKRCTAFLISDFVDDNFNDALKIACRKHDLVAIRLFDEREKELPNVGLLKIQDSETGKSIWVDSGSAEFRKFYKSEALRREENILTTFRKNGVDHTSIATHENYVKPLIDLFKRRGA
jgi:hypothetical protein